MMQHVLVWRGGSQRLEDQRALLLGAHLSEARRVVHEPLSDELRRQISCLLLRRRRGAGLSDDVDVQTVLCASSPAAQDAQRLPSADQRASQMALRWWCDVSGAM